MRRPLLFGLLVIALGGALAGTASAQSPTVVLSPMACIPADDNTPVTVAVSVVPAVGEARVYFRREGFGDFYYLPLDAAGGGAFWGVLPIPEPGNEAAELFAAVVDEEGNVVSRSSLHVVPVHQDCLVELDPQQQARAQRLTVGETTQVQMGQTVAWWRCEGISFRIDPLGELREDEVCAPEALWWQRPELLAPFAVIGGIGVTIMIIDDEPDREISPARP